MKIVTVYFSMSHMHIILLPLAVHVVVLNQIDLTDCFFLPAGSRKGKRSATEGAPFLSKKGRDCFD